MRFREGEIYEGGISITGGDGPFRRWIVVAPFGKPYLQTIDAPGDIRHRPLHALESGLRAGRIALVGYQPDHPALLLQRLKERHQISDTHLGLRGENLRKMLHLLDATARDGAPCTPFIAGEILSLHSEISYPSRWEWRDEQAEKAAVAERVEGLMMEWAKQVDGSERATSPAEVEELPLNA